MTNHLAGIPPTHPGEILREDVLPALGKSKLEIARLLGVSRPTLHDILAERRPITTPMALRLGKLLGNGPDLWLNLQRRFDVEQAQADMADELAAIPTLEAVELEAA
jgi:addiction module HigA family antidote